MRFTAVSYNAYQQEARFGNRFRARTQVLLLTEGFSVPSRSITIATNA